MKKIHRAISTTKSSYSCVIPLRLFGNTEIEDAAVEYNNTKRKLALIAETDSSVLAEGFHHLHSQDSRSLVLTRLHSEADARGFQEIFEETKGINWLLLGDSTFPELLRHIYLPVDNKVVITKADADPLSATFWQAYQAAPSLEQKVLPVGRWRRRYSGDLPPGVNQSDSAPSDSPGERMEDEYFSVKTITKRLTFGVARLPQGSIMLQRRDLTGLHLRCTTVENPPYTFLEYRSGGRVDVLGFIGSLFRHLKEVTNFTSDCHRVKDGGFGMVSDGEWTGMVGEVHRGEADIIVANLDLTLKRSAVVDFLIGVGQNQYVAIMKRPEKGDEMWTGYVKEFEQNVWIVLPFFVLTSILCAYFALRFHYSECTNVLSEAAITVIGFLLGQGSPLLPTQISLRILFLTILLFHVVLLAHYTSDLVSSLAAGPSLSKFSSLQDVAKDPKLQLGYTRETSLHDYLRDSSVEAIRQIWLSNRDKNFVSLTGSLHEGLERVLKGNYVFMKTEMAIHYNYGQDCRIYILPSAYFPGLYTIAVAKGSPFRHVFNKIILDARASGLLDKWMKAAVPKLADCSALSTSAIELNLVLVTFLVLGMAVLVSLGIFLLEYCVAKSKSFRGESGETPGRSRMVNNYMIK
ncbi:probable glutamate receptor [Macrobrachium rosenbergii]|uniref:probable glutamate receptor n=1 Tax=Macrobrachium rosenbergii TaxID=79674 RepID=UPI0034D39629